MSNRLAPLVRDLPSDPESALVQFCEQAAKIYSDSQGHFSAEEATFGVTFILRFADRYNVEIPGRRDEYSNSPDSLVALIRRVGAIRETILVRQTNREIDDLLADYDSKLDAPYGLARLNSDEKDRLNAAIERIRRIIEDSDLNDRKKNALFERLNELQREANSHGTKTDRFFAFAGDVGFAIGQMTKNAKPLFDEVKEILKIVTRSRAREEGVSLPPGDEVLKLPAPPREPGS